MGGQPRLCRAMEMLTQAMNEDRSGNYHHARSLYDQGCKILDESVVYEIHRESVLKQIFEKKRVYEGRKAELTRLISYQELVREFLQSNQAAAQFSQLQEPAVRETKLSKAIKLLDHAIQIDRSGQDYHSALTLYLDARNYLEAACKDEVLDYRLKADIRAQSDFYARRIAKLLDYIEASAPKDKKKDCDLDVAIKGIKKLFAPPSSSKIKKPAIPPISIDAEEKPTPTTNLYKSIELLTRGTAMDKSNAYEKAFDLYTKGCDHLWHALKYEVGDDDQKDAIRLQLSTYVQRAEQIKHQLDQTARNANPSFSASASPADRQSSSMYPSLPNADSVFEQSAFMNSSSFARDARCSNPARLAQATRLSTSSMAQATTTTEASQTQPEDKMGTRVMYLLLRKDLETALKWPIGALCTQAAHAATACLWMYKDDPDVKAYMGELDHMHKITLAVDDEKSLEAIAERLNAASIHHKVWIEDNMPVCIAVKPQPRAALKTVLGRLPLYK